MTGWPNLLLFLRHGEAEVNVLDAKAKRDGVTLKIAEKGAFDQSLLTNQGVKQSVETGIFLAQLFPRLDVIYCSPLQRTRETADDVALALRYSVKIVLEDRLRELDFGDLDGLTKRGIEQYFPGEVQKRQEIGKYRYRFPGGESYEDVYQRVSAAVKDIRERDAGKNVLLVGHEVVGMVLRKDIEGITEAEVEHIGRVDTLRNCGLIHYAFDPAKNSLALREYNRILHGG